MFKDKKIGIKNTKVNGDVINGDKIEINNYHDSSIPYKRDAESSNILKNNQKQDYLDKWNDVLFLHKGEPEDKQVRLSDLYILPDYVYENRTHNNLYDEIEYFIHSQEEHRILFVMGQAGLGKSSLVSFLSSKDNNYIYICFKDLGDIGDILEAILRYFACSEMALENRILILDGFDEARIKGNNSKIIDDFIGKIWNIDGLKAVSTSRLHYFKTDYNNIIYIKKFDGIKINEFNNVYNSKTCSLINVTTMNYDTEIYGIPLILYMIHALNLDINQYNDKCKLYCKIFSTDINDGGVYVKCRTKGYGYSGDKYHKLMSEHIGELHRIAQRIAFSMFEKNESELNEDEYKKIVKSISKDRINDFGIANYYDIGNTLSFVHKSICDIL